MNESTMKSVAMLRELADGIEEGSIALFEVRKTDRHETTQIQRQGDRSAEFIPTGVTDIELTINYRR
ncbi:hypothetical protein [Undibacterium sp. Di24W]|uniref:hypothetical protein n=1 Tax=Undibacterium sp. Di24W TaxID=3413033 RepID=UPI003BEFDCE0